MAQRRCRIPDDFGSPSPPPSCGLDTPLADTDLKPWKAPSDYLSSLPQELIEEIGLLACSPPFTDDPSEPFQADRHRLRTLNALSLVSKEFNQIFNLPLYLEPLIIDTQRAKSLNLRNSAEAWVNPTFYNRAPLAKRFTFWRPRSEEMNKPFFNGLHPVNPVLCLCLLGNLRELTFSGNFSNDFPPQGIHGRPLAWLESTLMPKCVPHLHSVRILDVDDAELINVLLTGIAHQLKTLVIYPSPTGLSNYYSPRNIYSHLRGTIEKLTTVEDLTISLPGMKVGINHCNHGHKLIQKTLCAVPKDTLKNLTLELPLFDCRSVQWIDASDEEEDEVAMVDHAWFWMTLQNFLAGFEELDSFSFKGSYVPEEIRRKLHTVLPTTSMSFTKAERNQVVDTSNPRLLSFRQATPTPGDNPPTDNLATGSLTEDNDPYRMLSPAMISEMMASIGPTSTTTSPKSSFVMTPPPISTFVLTPPSTVSSTWSSIFTTTAAPTQEPSPPSSASPWDSGFSFTNIAIPPVIQPPEQIQSLPLLFPESRNASWTYNNTFEPLDQNLLNSMEIDSLPPISSINSNMFASPPPTSDSWQFPNPPVRHDFTSSPSPQFSQDWANGPGSTQDWQTSSSAADLAWLSLPTTAFQPPDDELAEDSGLGTQSTMQETQNQEERDWGWFINDE